MPSTRERACRSCGAAIVFLATAHGKRLPVDAATVRPDEHVFAPQSGHLAHWATCPDREHWRRQKT